MNINVFLQGDALKVLKTLPDKSVNTCVTSPPYFQLRDYKVKGQIGLERTPQAFIRKLVKVFREVRRVLRDDGTLWLNIGDSYAGYIGDRYTHAQKLGKYREDNVGQTPPARQSPDFKKSKIKSKDLYGIPWMLAFALRDDGWYLRQDIIWHKPSCMPESVSDRCTKNHEYIFLLSKKKKYYFDAFAISTPIKDKTLTTYGAQVTGAGDGSGLVGSENWASRVPVRKPKVWKTPDGWDTSNGTHTNIHPAGKSKGLSVKDKATADMMAINGSTFKKGHPGNYRKDGTLIGDGRANKRSVWTISSEQSSDPDHFASFPQKLIIDCIKAGCPEGGIVLDPFSGTGTTALVARKAHRNFVGIDLNEKDVKKSKDRLKKELGMFA